MTTRATSPVLIGRHTESAALAAAYRVAVAEAATFVVVAGDAGIGKSRLVREFAAGLEGARRVTGECLELGADQLPFAPFLAVLRRLRRDLGVGAMRELLPPGDLSLARWLPDLGRAAVDLDPLEGRTRLFEELLTLLERLAADRPLVVVLEDLHWADPASVDLLAFLVRNLDQAGLLVICTYRSADVGATDPLRPVLADLARRPGHHFINPGPLSAAETAELLTGLLGSEPDRGLVARIHDRSDGNPFFIEALAADPAGGTPAPLRDWVAAELAKLPDSARSVLRAAAVAGHLVPHALLMAVAGLTVTDLEPALRELAEKQLLVVGSDGYAFRHSLLREAVVDDVLPGEWQRLNARCAEAIAADRSLVAQPDAELAARWEAAGERARALDAAWNAAAEAERSFAYEQQWRMLERVLSWWNEVSEPETRLGASRAEVLQQAAEACASAGAFERGITHATAALASTGQNALRARALATRGFLSRRVGRDGDADLEAALEVLPADAPVEFRGRLLGSLAINASRWNGDPQQSAQYAAEALRIGREHGLLGVQATALLASGRTAGLAGNSAEALRLFRSAGELAKAASYHYTALTALLSEAYTLMLSGDYAQAAVVAGEGRTLVYRVGQGRSRGADLAAVLAQALWLSGRWPEAKEVIDDALAEDPPAAMAGVLLDQAAEIALVQGDLIAAQQAVEKSTPLLTTAAGRETLPVYVAAVHCRVALAQGDLVTADRILTEALADPAISVDPWSVLRAGAELLRRLTGRPDQLASRWAELDALAGKSPTNRPALLAHHLTFTAELTGDLAAWDAAVSAWREVAQPYQLALALFGMAESAVAAGQRVAAEERLRESAALARELGAAALLHEIEQLSVRGRLDLAVPETPQPAVDRPFGLTSREFDVLRLLTAGRTNSQIATELFISPSTAGVHVSRILAKLHVSRRTEAAAVAHRLALF
ncbi:helix-turn-helix transcriptional regulator [Kribbella sp. NPDC056345]|uniref:helix-turn-helix transcriptional regulator n=1 Tax=Kribbella sp. NPDC056345 TaxID=3345789 RepID=UPI0035DBFB72